MNSKNLKTIIIKGKDYVTVNERIKYFRENFSGYSMTTDIIHQSDMSKIQTHENMNGVAGLTISHGKSVIPFWQ